MDNNNFLIDIEKIIRMLCCRHTGIGADGLFIISSSTSHDFLLDYYNSDGSWETLCANGSRCAVKFMYQCGLIENKTSFIAGDGPHSASILNNGAVSMQMKSPKYCSSLVSPIGCNGYFINSGARHFVTESENLAYDFINKIGKTTMGSLTDSVNGMLELRNSTLTA